MRCPGSFTAQISYIIRQIKIGFLILFYFFVHPVLLSLPIAPFSLSSSLPSLYMYMILSHICNDLMNKWLLYVCHRAKPFFVPIIIKYSYNNIKVTGWLSTTGVGFISSGVWWIWMSEQYRSAHINGRRATIISAAVIYIQNGQMEWSFTSNDNQTINLGMKQL